MSHDEVWCCLILQSWFAKEGISWGRFFAMPYASVLFWIIIHLFSLHFLFVSVYESVDVDYNENI